MGPDTEVLAHAQRHFVRSERGKEDLRQNPLPGKL